MEEELTVEYIMKATLHLLGEIQVPMAMFEQIGQPIASAINNLKIGLMISKKDEPKEEAKEETEAGPDA